MSCKDIIVSAHVLPAHRLDVLWLLVNGAMKVTGAGTMASAVFVSRIDTNL